MCKIVLSISCLQQPFVCLNCVCLQRKQQVSPRALRLMQCRCTRLHLTPRKLFSISGGKVWSVSTQRFLPYTFSGARIGTDQGRLEREIKKGPCGGSGESIEFLPVEDRLSLLFLQFFIIFFWGGVVLSSLCGQHFPFHGEESLRVNLNALGDSVVSFAVLALSTSPDGSMVAACTDRSRVIVLQVWMGFGNWRGNR